MKWAFTRLFVASLLVILFVLSFPPHVVSAPSASCGTTITSTTVLTGDLLNCPANGITIGANAITLDCQNHMVAGSGNFATNVVGITSQGQLNITIRNCVVQNFRFGVLLRSTNQSQLTNNNADNNFIAGFDLLVSVKDSLSNNTALKNGNAQIGVNFFLGGSSYNVLTHNNSLNSTQDGFRLRQSSKNTLDHNTAKNNGYNGITLVNASDSNTLVNNQVVGNAVYGFGQDFVEHNNISSNIIEKNSFGIGLLDSSSNNLIYNNVFDSVHINAIDTATNTWNIAKTPRNNIIGGPFLGGNFWSDYHGTDPDGDGLGDTLLPYNSNCLIVNGGDSLPLVSSQFRVSEFFTNPTLSPLPLDSNSNPSVVLPLARGLVRSTNPGQVLAWVNVTNTGSTRLQSLKLNETLPVDWVASPAWLPATGAIHVFFANTTSLATNLDITQPSTITVSPGNPETVSLSIPSLNATLIGHPLMPGQSILLSVKLTYALKDTSQSPSSYPRIYTDTSVALAWTKASFTGTESIGSGSAFFIADAKVAS